MRRFWRWLLRLMILVVFVGAAALYAMWTIWTPDLPDVKSVDLLALGGETRVYDRAGRLIGVLNPSVAGGAVLSGELLHISEISQPMRKAVVSSEDRRFFEHSGLDAVGMARGLLRGILFGNLQGGSTITQQLVKNTLLDDLEGARTLERKFKEIVLARRVEQHFDKNQILAAYLNVVYFGQAEGRSIVGIDAAAHAYFDKPASELSLPESLYLASIIPSPNSRYKTFAELRPLQRSILDRLVEDGRYTPAQAEEAWRTAYYPAGWRIGWNDDGTVRSATLENPARLAEQMPKLPPRVAFHYLQAVERELVREIGREKLLSSAKIYTGLDLDDQLAAEAAARAANLPEGATLGMAFVDAGSGEVRAMVGQKLYGGRPADWDNATQARRQVGSSVKPFVYTLALSRGWEQDDTVLDTPLDGEYQPNNYSGDWLGAPVTLRYALDHSLNLPTVRLANEVGLRGLESKLREMDFAVADDLGLSLSIGTLEASPVQLAAAYAPFANGGLYFPPTFARQVIDNDGAVIYQRPAPDVRRVWDEQSAYLGLDMLLGVVNDLSTEQGGLATLAKIDGWPVGGKTGTTNDVRDLWFAGVVPGGGSGGGGVAGAVWVGREDNQPLPQNAYSGTVPTPIWQQAMQGILAGETPRAFAVPAGIEYAHVRRVDMAFRRENLTPETVTTSASDWWAGLLQGPSPITPDADAAEQAQTPEIADTPFDSPQDLPPELQGDSDFQPEPTREEDADVWSEQGGQSLPPAAPPDLPLSDEWHEQQSEAAQRLSEQAREAEQRFREELERGREALREQLQQQLNDAPVDEWGSDWRSELERSLNEAVGQ